MRLTVVLLVPLLSCPAAGCARTDDAAGHTPPPAKTPPPPAKAPAPAPLAPSDTAPPSVTPPVQAPAARPPQADPRSVDDLLDRLEHGAADLESFTAAARYDMLDDLTGEIQTRKGEIIYRVQGSEKRFAVLFDELIIDNIAEPGKRRKARKTHYVFDGHWLAEIDHEDKQFIKHELVPPGQTLDPLKLEGPLPLPIGQSREDVLARFEASLLPPPAAAGENVLGPDRALTALTSSFALDGLLLVPKPGTRLDREGYARLELWYDRATLIPVGINVVLRNGNRKVLVLSHPMRNPLLDDGALAKLRIDEPPGEGWQKTVHRYEQAAEPTGPEGMDAEGPPIERSD